MIFSTCRYVGNLPPGITVPQLAEFLNSAMKQLGLAKDLSSVVTAWVSPDGHYAFVELRSVEEATAALNYLNGVQVGVYSLKIGRPKGYNGGSSSVLVPMQASVTTPTTGPLGLTGLANGITSNPLLSTSSLAFNSSISSEPLSNVIMVSNLPALISEEQIRELFTPFGEVIFACYI
jgi:splicing factor U2AF subunit